MTTITVDYDSSELRISNGVTIRLKQPMYVSHIRAMLSEVLNAIGPKDVSLAVQDEGRTRTVEEW